MFPSKYFGKRWQSFPRSLFGSFQQFSAVLLTNSLIGSKILCFSSLSCSLVYRYHVDVQPFACSLRCGRVSPVPKQLSPGTQERQPTRAAPHVRSAWAGEPPSPTPSYVLKLVQTCKVQKRNTIISILLSDPLQR